MNSLSLSETDRLPLHKLVYSKLRESILTGVLRPGEKLIENEISKQLHISKTPIREAIRELSQEGLIVHHTRRGISVIDFKESDIEEITVLRAELEGLAIRLAFSSLNNEDFSHMDRIIRELHTCDKKKDFACMAQKDLEFHCYLIEKSGNRRLLKAWKTIASQMQVLLQMLDFYALSENYSVNSHKQLLEALKKGTAETASNTIRKHVIQSKENVLRVFQQKNS